MSGRRALGGACILLEKLDRIADGENVLSGVVRDFDGLTSGNHRYVIEQGFEMGRVLDAYEELFAELYDKGTRK